MGMKNSEYDKIVAEQRKEAQRQKMVLDCLIEHPEYTKIIKSKYLTDDMYEQVMQIEPEIFGYIKEPTIRVINTALDIDGGYLRFLPKKKRESLPISSYEIAIDSNPKEAVKYIPKEVLKALMTDERELEIFKEYPEVIKDTGINVKESILHDYIMEYPSQIKFVNSPSEELICDALSVDPMVALYFPVLTEKEMDIIDARWPQFRDNLPNYTRKNKGDIDNGTENKEITKE